MADEFEPEIQRVVRRYSLMVAESSPDDTLSQALGASAQQDIDTQKRKECEAKQLSLRSKKETSDQEVVQLEEQWKRLTEVWSKFQSQFKLESLGPGDSPPPIEDIVKEVEEAEKTWNAKKESGVGKAKAGVENFLSMMNDHSFLFSVIPDGDKYTSLITGVVSSVVKMSVNHKKNAEGFSSALTKIGYKLKSVKRSSKISNTLDMKVLVVNFYIEVFDFLCHSMEWYQKPALRFRASVNKNFYERELKGRIDKVDEAIGRIEQEVKQTTQERVQRFEQAGFTMYDLLKDVSDKSRESNVAIEDKFDTIVSALQVILGNQAKQTLLAAGQQEVYDTMRKNSRLLESKSSPDITGDSEGIPPNAIASFARSDIEERLAFLDTYLDKGRPGNLSGSSQNSKLPGEVMLRIQKWIKVPASDFLWIEGPTSTSSEERLSFAAMCVCDLVLSAGIPCISFFARYIPKSQLTGAASGMSSREAALIDLLYSLACQLVRLLPSEFEGYEGFDEQSLLALDGSIDSASAALSLIEALLNHAPPTVIVVIDKIHLADSPATRPHLTSLISTLRNHGTEVIIKALFTTAGACGVLAKSTKLSERVDAGRMVQAKPSQPLKGWSSLNDLRLGPSTE